MFDVWIIHKSFFGWLAANVWLLNPRVWRLNHHVSSSDHHASKGQNSPFDLLMVHVWCPQTPFWTVKTRSLTVKTPHIAALSSFPRTSVAASVRPNKRAHKTTGACATRCARAGSMQGVKCNGQGRLTVKNKVVFGAGKWMNIVHIYESFAYFLPFKELTSGFHKAMLNKPVGFWWNKDGIRWGINPTFLT